MQSSKSPVAQVGMNGIDVPPTGSFSEGWQPGQPTTRAGPQATGNVGAWKLSDLSKANTVAEVPQKRMCPPRLHACA
jgi:hypothetical protein